MSEGPGCFLDALVDLVLGELADPEPEGHVLVDCHVGIQGVVLEHHRDVAVLGRDVVDELVVDEKLALGDVLEAGDHPQRRGLAAARRADEDHELLVINDKEFVIFVGPSGCGKSTTLRMIAGLEDITEGELYIDDKLVNDVPPKDRDIAMVFQNYALVPAHDRLREHGLRAQDPQAPQRRDRQARQGSRREPSTSRSSSSAGPSSFQAASASGSRSAAPSSAIPRYSSSTSRYPTSTPSSASRCAPSSSTSTTASTRR